MDWSGACIVPLYKVKGDKYECTNSRGNSLLSVVGKLHGRILINSNLDAIQLNWRVLVCANLSTHPIKENLSVTLRVLLK